MSSSFFFFRPDRRLLFLYFFLGLFSGEVLAFCCSILLVNVMLYVTFCTLVYTRYWLPRSDRLYSYFPDCPNRE